MQKSALLLHWRNYRWACNVWVLIFIFPPSYVALCASKAHHRLGSESVSWCVETSLFLDSLPGMELCPYLFCLFFCLLCFLLPPFEDNGFLFWVSDVLCRHSEVVLWNLLSVQMFFDEFVGEKVVSTSYSSAILGPLPSWLGLDVPAFTGDVQGSMSLCE